MVKCTRRVKRRAQLSWGKRAEVLERCGVQPNGGWQAIRCHWCGVTGLASWSPTPTSPTGAVGTQGLEFDHLVPLSAGGANEAWNVVLACSHCNRSRGARLPWEWSPC